MNDLCENCHNCSMDFMVDWCECFPEKYMNSECIHKKYNMVLSGYEVSSISGINDELIGK